MPHEDNYAFDAMNKAAPDNDITGGAIMYSEYEMDMTPKEQAKYEKVLLESLDLAYRDDPHKGKLGFKDWLDNLKPDLVRERALEWDKVRNDKDAMNKMDPKEYSIIEGSGLLQNLLDKHTGSVEDVRDVIGDKVPRDVGEFKIEEIPLRRYGKY